MQRHSIDVEDWKEELLQRYLDRGSVQAYEQNPSDNVYFAAHQIVVAAADVPKIEPLLGRLRAERVEDPTVLPNAPDRPSQEECDGYATKKAPKGRRPHVRSRGDLSFEPGQPSSAPSVVAYRIDERVNPAEFVLEQRDNRARRGVSIGLNHLATGLQIRKGFPAGDPEPTKDRWRSRGALKKVPGAGVGVAVVDTGFPVRFPPVVDWFDTDVSWASLPGEPDHVDLLDSPGDGFLDAEAGHGFYVAGLVRRVAPGAPLHFVRALDSNGLGTELGVAAAIRQAARRPIQVLNLSLGFYTLQNLPSVDIAAALAEARRLRPGLAVVAAVGNDGQAAPAWPAAGKGVVAVGALDGGGKALAPFSNRGPWVDVNAPGTWVAAPYVEGVEDARLTRDRNSDRFDGRARWSGTSFACALVSGTIAATLPAGADAALHAQALLAGLPPTPGAFGGLLTPEFAL